jgi:hypothetical protein
MITISRRLGERVQIGEGITITVVETTRGTCRLAIDAPGQNVERLPPQQRTVTKARRGGAKRVHGKLPEPAPCPHHGPAACCPECPDHQSTDGRGFPHPSERRGRIALQRCPECRELRPPEQWVHDIDAARFGCTLCIVGAPPR